MTHNIVMIVSSFYPRNGGVEQVVYQVSKRLVQKGIKISILTPRYDSNASKEETIEGIHIYRFEINKKRRIGKYNVPVAGQLSSFCSLHEYWRLLKQAEVVHCHDWSTFIYWYLPYRFIFLFKPVYITFHGNEGVFPIPKRILFLRKFTEILTNDNICVGHYICKWYKTHCRNIVYGGVDVDLNFRSVCDPHSAVFVGRLERDTGILTYLEAIRLLQQEYGLRIKLEVFGEGSLIDTVKQFIDQNTLDVHLNGFVTSTNKAAIFSKGNFAFVSQNLAILEAMASRKLVFAVYDNPLKHDYVHSYPNADEMLVASGSVQELVDNYLYYISHIEESEKLKNNAYSYASRMTWDDVVKKHLMMYGYE